MLHRFEVANIKCGGCARSIDKGKSFVSCAIGRFGSK